MLAIQNFMKFATPNFIITLFLYHGDLRSRLAHAELEGRTEWSKQN